MIQIINISDARNNLAKLIQTIKSTKKPVVIVQDSIPSVVIYPYEDILKKEQEKDRLFQIKFDKIFEEGKQSFKQYLKANKLPTPKTEEDAYNIIKHA